MKSFPSFVLFSLLTLFFAQGQQTFTHAFGGEGDERAMAVVQTRTGDYVVAGQTFSYGNGKSDIWIMKLDPQGSEIWRRYLGGSDFDWANSLIETRDGNYVLAGFTQNGKKGRQNAWILQIDPNGQEVWSHTYGGEKSDEAKSIVQTKDGGFAVAGLSHSFSRGNSDVWVLRLDEMGNEVWQRNFGGKGPDHANAIAEADNGDLVLGGFTKSFGNGKADMLVLRVNKDGKGIWRKNFGGAENEAIEDLIITQDGHIVLTGWTASNTDKQLDGMAIRLDEKGEVIWKKSYGESGRDAFYDITVTKDGNLALAGSTTVVEGKPSQVWLVKVDNFGRKLWHKYSKGKQNDVAYAITSTFDGGYALVGGTKSYAIGGTDMWVLKTDSKGKFSTGREPVQDQYALAQHTQKEVESNSENIFKPNLYILTVGVSRFLDQSANLTFAHIDASDVADRFATLEGKIFNKVKVRKLLNEQANLVNIKMGISWLEKEATQNDVVLIFISSHGALDNKGNLYILPTDYNAYNLFATALNIRDLTEGMNGTPCKKLILLDACHSGQSGNDLVEFASVKAGNVNDIVEELMGKEPGVTVMTSSSGKEYSYENPRWGHGAFTKAILEGLDGQADFNKDRTIHLMELNLYVTNRVKELTGGRQHPYTPINLFGDIPLFMLD